MRDFVMNKKIFTIFSVLVVLFTLLFVCVGCADNSTEDSDEVTFIDFSRESASSRGIESWNENLYPPEKLYWTYKATKIRGNYTTGQTNGEEKAVVKNGPAQGLGTVGPFSVGVWKFELFGYLSCAEDPTTDALKFTDLVYTGKTGTAENAYTTTIDKRPAGTSGVQEIIFELTANNSFSGFAKGELELKNMYLTVPEGQKITKNSSVRVTVTDVTATPVKVVAVSTTDVTDTDKESGTEIPLNAFDFAGYAYADHIFGVNSDGSAKVYKLEFKAEYKDVFTSAAVDDAATPQPQYTDGWAEIGTISTYPIAFKGGVKTTISGDINDIEVDTDEYHHKVKYDWAVAKITWKDADSNPDGTGVDYSIYTTFKEAVTKYLDNTDKVSTTKNYVELIHDLDIAETVTVSADVPVYMNKHFAEGITINGTGSLTFKMATDITRDYKISGDGFVVNNIKPEKTGSDEYVWLTTTDTTGTGTVEVTASTDTVWHTGTAGTVKVITCEYAMNTDGSADKTKGYHLGTDKDGADPVTKVGTVEITAGNFEIGGCTTVESLLVKGTSVKLWGKRNSVVNAYNYDGMTTALKAKNTAQAVFDDHQSNAKLAFTEVVLDGNNGGKTSGNKEQLYLYGIEGMEVELPATYPFTYGSHSQRCWNTEADNSGLMCEDRYVVGSSADNILYGVWYMLPIGGPIYYITPNTEPDGTNPSDLITGGENGAIAFGDIIYRFYDKNGVAVDIKDLKYQRTANNEIAEPGLTDKLTEAVYYTVLGTPTEDKFYAVDMTNGKIGITNSGVGVGIGNSVEGVGYGGYGTLIDGKLGSVSTLAASDCVGQGKKITNAILATKGTSGGVFEKLISMEGTLGPVGSVVSALGNNTLWAYIDFLNNGTKYPVAGYEGTYVVWSGEYGMKKAESKPFGINDWFVPGLRDVSMVGVWCGAAKYNSAANFEFSAATNVPTNPVIREVYDMIVGATYFRCATETDATHTPFWDGSGWSPNGLRGYSNCSMFAVRGF